MDVTEKELRELINYLQHQLICARAHRLGVVISHQNAERIVNFLRQKEKGLQQHGT